MAIPLGIKPAHDFDEPLGLLSDCHRRIETFLGALIKVAQHARASDEPLTPEQRRALETALTYFRSAAPRHTQDEEHSLFPRLRACNDPRVQDAMARIDALEADHRTAETAHAEVDDLGTRWLQAGHLPPADLEHLTSHLTMLQDLYTRHIAIEDTEVFPLAKESLDPKTIAELGQEMAQRRGLKR